ncbi:hypothetical protein [Fodinibius sp.]|uniref:hypothetical protein n=1 Tax=Fodinibius sp. TaxID=1872440 RepID=UPI002ACE98FC|nr:hypothetical protein [Fodinibius sp.]MDZ7658051.1 hypothetical protein [Fodinibius sp.]
MKNSLEEAGNETPAEIETKAEAQGMMHLINPNRRQMAVLFDYVQSIGADKQLLSNHPDEEKKKTRNQAVFQKWFQTLVVQNGRFPRDIPIDFVLQHFAQCVVQNKVDIKGFNLREQVRAFHEYLDNYERELRGKWWQYQNPDQRPKAITESANTERRGNSTI